MGGICTVQKSVPVIVRGEDIVLDVFLTKDNSNQPFDLTLATQIVAVLPNQEGSSPLFLEKTLTGGGIVVVSGPGGNFQILATAAQTKILAVNEATSLDVRLTIGGKLTIVVIQNAINIVDPAYPAAP